MQLVSSTSTSETDALAWLVIVECDDGSRHEVKVLLAGAALSPPSDSMVDIRQGEGKRPVLAALAADPTRVPTQIICSTEGCQPEYEDPLAAP